MSSSGYISGRNDGLRADQMLCPACGRIAECESVDVGVGFVIRGDFSCECGWCIDGPEYFGFIDIDEVPFSNLPPGV